MMAIKNFLLSIVIKDLIKKCGDLDQEIKVKRAHEESIQRLFNFVAKKYNRAEHELKLMKGIYLYILIIIFQFFISRISL